MKKIFLVLFLFALSLSAQTIQLYWDLDGDKLADETFVCADGDTITAHLYITNTDTANIVSGKPIFAFDIPIIYGYYTRWSSNPYYSNILVLDSVGFDTTAIADSTGIFSYLHNSSAKRIIMSYEDSTSTAIEVDSCIATLVFIVDGEGSQLLHFNYLGAEDNNNIKYNTVVLDDRKYNYSLWVRDCLIISN